MLIYVQLKLVELGMVDDKRWATIEEKLSLSKRTSTLKKYLGSSRLIIFRNQWIVEYAII